MYCTHRNLLYCTVTVMYTGRSAHTMAVRIQRYKLYGTVNYLSLSEIQNLVIGAVNNDYAADMN